MVCAYFLTTSFRARSLSKPYSPLFENSTSIQVSEKKGPQYERLNVDVYMIHLVFLIRFAII